MKMELTLELTLDLRVYKEDATYLLTRTLETLEGLGNTPKPCDVMNLFRNLAIIDLRATTKHIYEPLGIRGSRGVDDFYWQVERLRTPQELYWTYVKSHQDRDLG